MRALNMVFILRVEVSVSCTKIRLCRSCTRHIEGWLREHQERLKLQMICQPVVSADSGSLVDEKNKFSTEKLGGC